MIPLVVRHGEEVNAFESSPANWDSAFTSNKLAPAAALDGMAGCGRARYGSGGAQFAGGARRLRLPKHLPERTDLMSGDFLVLVPVRDLQWDDVVYDEHGERRIIEIRRDHGRAYIEFSAGPSNWFLDNEMFPCERLS